jgi:hypothetical protein
LGCANRMLHMRDRLPNFRCLLGTHHALPGPGVNLPTQTNLQPLRG